MGGAKGIIGYIFGFWRGGVGGTFPKYPWGCSGEKNLLIVSVSICGMSIVHSAIIHGVPSQEKRKKLKEILFCLVAPVGMFDLL